MAISSPLPNLERVEPQPLDRPRLLRECAVSLIRASDLSPELAVQRIRDVMTELGEIAIDLNADTRLPLAFAASGKRRAA